KARNRWCSTRPRTASTRRSRSCYGASRSSEARGSLGSRRHHIGAMTPPDRIRDPASIDQLLSFTLPDRHARGRMVRLGPVLGRILAAHAYPQGIKELLAEALVLTAVMGALLK